MHKFVVMMLAGILVGCASSKPPVSSASLTVIDGVAGLPEPGRSDLVAADRPSFIGPLDTVTVDVFGVPDLTRELQVDGSGRISMPLVGVVDARGKTAEELAGVIENALRGRYVRNPEVTVNIKSSVSQVVTVDGQVKKPGLYPVTNQMTLLRAIASAEGLDEFAKLNDVVILRTVADKRLAGLYDIGAIRRGVYADPPVYANDIILVGDNPTRRMFKDLISVSPLLSAPLIALVQKN